jgi:hypothetical protein
MGDKCSCLFMRRFSYKSLIINEKHLSAVLGRMAFCPETHPIKNRAIVAEPYYAARLEK